MERGREGRWGLNGTPEGERERKEKVRSEESYPGEGSLPALGYYDFQSTPRELPASWGKS